MIIATHSCQLLVIFSNFSMQLFCFGLIKLCILVSLIINILCSSMQNNLLLVISNRMISHFYTDMLAAMATINTCWWVARFAFIPHAISRMGTLCYNFVESSGTLRPWYICGWNTLILFLEWWAAVRCPCCTRISNALQGFMNGSLRCMLGSSLVIDDSVKLQCITMKYGYWVLNKKGIPWWKIYICLKLMHSNKNW